MSCGYKNESKLCNTVRTRAWVLFFEWRRMTRVLQADRMPTITQVTTCMQKSNSEHTDETCVRLEQKTQFTSGQQKTGKNVV